MPDLTPITDLLVEIADGEKYTGETLNKVIAALVTHMNDMRRQLNALDELVGIKTELQANNKALQAMVAGLMELLSKLQPPALVTGLTDLQKSTIVNIRNQQIHDRMAREIEVLLEYVKRTGGTLVESENGEIRHVTLEVK